MTITAWHLTDGEDCLRVHREGRPAPQPVFVHLDLAERLLYADYDAELPGTAVPAHVLRWPIPPLAASAANALINELVPHAAAVLAGVEIARTNDRLAHVLSPARQAAQEAIAQRCAGLFSAEPA